MMSAAFAILECNVILSVLDGIDMQCQGHQCGMLCNAGAIPIPGCKTVTQVQEHVGAMGWRLDSNDIAIIDERRTTLK